MIYEIIEIPTNFGFSEKMVVGTNEDGSSIQFPVDENNPVYQAYLNPQAALSTPNV